MTGTRSRTLAIVVTALAVVAVTLLAVVVREVGSQNRSNRNTLAATTATYLASGSAKAAQAAAQTEVQATLTYNYKTLQADFATALKGMTPSFATQYKKTTEDEVTPLATQYHAISSATVAASGVSEATATSATVLLFVNQAVKNTQLTAKERLDRSRIRVNMVKLDGRWLINDLHPI
jgi:Mce-associated membrane protein